MILKNNILELAATVCDLMYILVANHPCKFYFLVYIVKLCSTYSTFLLKFDLFHQQKVYQVLWESEALLDDVVGRTLQFQQEDGAIIFYSLEFQKACEYVHQLFAHLTIFFHLQYHILNALIIRWIQKCLQCRCHISYWNFIMNDNWIKKLRCYYYPSFISCIRAWKIPQLCLDE